MSINASVLRVVLIFGIAFAGTALSPSAYAQGCTLCRDTTAGSAPQVRAALRRAIPVLGVPAVALFCATLGIAFRIRDGRYRDE